MAVKFKYPFQKIVDLKETEKTQAEWMLSASLGKLAQEKLTLEELYMEKESTMESIYSSASLCCVSSLQQLQSYVSRLEHSIKKQLDDVQLAEDDVVRSQDHLSLKMKDEKVWLQARDKARERFRHEMQLLEQNELDEMATLRFAMAAR